MSKTPKSPPNIVTAGVDDNAEAIRDAAQKSALAAVAVSDDVLSLSTDPRVSWFGVGQYAIFLTADPVFYGKLVAITPTHYFLEDTVWVADTGRAHEFVADPSKASEVERLGNIMVERPVVAVFEAGKQVPVKMKAR